MKNIFEELAEKEQIEVLYDEVIEPEVNTENEIVPFVLIVK